MGEGRVNASEFLLERLVEWGFSRASDRPVVAHNLQSSLVKGDADRAGVVRETVRSVLASFAPGNRR
jgi:hypothetical protein